MGCTSEMPSAAGSMRLAPGVHGLTGKMAGHAVSNFLLSFDTENVSALVDGAANFLE
jgi:hypothetical protein